LRRLPIRPTAGLEPRGRSFLRDISESITLNTSKTVQRVRLRRGRLDESDAVARLFRLTSDREWSFLYPHTPQEDRAFFRAAFEKGPVWVAVDGGLLVGFCAAHRGWIDHLYVVHERHGQGIGQALLRRTLRGRSRVRLWTFQRNLRSRDFYRRQGFVEVRFTDGRDNEEKEPDVLREWRRPRA
jgi:putative acetyltransferase